jgi:hypothetical protein
MPHPIGPIGLTAAEQALLALLTARQQGAGRPAVPHESRIAVPMPLQGPGHPVPPRPDERRRERR